MDRRAIPGIAFWVLFLSCAVFQVSRYSWYDLWPIEARINFWVAVGTIALALVTTFSLFVTNAVVSAEDRRHQQGLAPVVTLSAIRGYYNDDVRNPRTLEGFAVSNVGLGPALLVTIEATLETAPSPFNESSSERFVAHVSALPSGANQNVINETWRFDEDEPPPYPRLEGLCYMNVQLSYTDIFGNSYKTIYLDEHLSQYHWDPPNSLFTRRFNSSRRPES
jgi:hypothetical protein